jgi:hypothetical protein
MNLLIWIAFAALLPLGSSGLSGSHTLSSGQSSMVAAWLSAHPGYRLAEDRGCECDEDIQSMRAGAGGVWKPVPNYDPNVASGDFNSDGIVDFAVVVISVRKAQDFTLLVFNGPIDVHHRVPAFVDQNRDMRRIGLFYGSPRPKPYRLLIGPFESEGLVLQPRGKTYRLVE